MNNIILFLFLPIAKFYVYDDFFVYNRSCLAQTTAACICSLFLLLTLIYIDIDIDIDIEVSEKRREREKEKEKERGGEREQ